MSIEFLDSWNLYDFLEKYLYINEVVISLLFDMDASFEEDLGLACPLELFLYDGLIRSHCYSE